MLPATPAKRIPSIDILRGMVMVIMALDHTRDYFTNFYHDATDLGHASTLMFLTRWITHFCAPIFIFLAGSSAFLSFSKGKTKKEAALFLLTRGLWLVFLELTIVRFGWMFNMDYTQLYVQVIWAIGWSMVALAGLIFLPKRLVLIIGLLMIAGHNALDSIHAGELGAYSGWWNLFHEFGNIQITDQVGLLILYPLVPWIGVMATGYCFGQVMQMDERERHKWLYRIGATAILLFIILRYINIYGDPEPWHQQGAWWRTVLSFLDCSKYPPSLLYLLMTIGPAIFLLPAIERMRNAAGRFFTVYGRVPMFYYILHIYLVHGMALLVGNIFYHVPVYYYTGNNTIFAPKPNWGFYLPVVYAYWLLIILLLYLPCRWFMRIKLAHKKWWLSYL